MGSISQLIRNTKSLNLNAVIEESITERQKPLVVLQQEQMLKGYRSNGGRIGRYRSLQYAKMKYGLSRKAGFKYKDLRLTGDFQRDIFVDIRDKSIIFTSGDSKTDDIVKREGDNIFGLMAERRSFYSIKVLQPLAIQKIKRHILK